MAEYHNEGVAITNSTVTGPVAGGHRAQATQYGASTTNVDAVDAVVTQLRDLIQQHRAVLQEADLALRDLDDIVAELRRPVQDPSRIRDAVRRLGARVAPVVTLIGLAADLDQLLGHAIGH